MIDGCDLGELTGFKAIQAPIPKLILSKNQYFQFVIFSSGIFL